MGTITRFEDLKVWQKARSLNQRLLPVIRRMHAAHEWGLKDQVARSAGSVMDNLAEGFDRGGNREFLTFVGYAKGSNAELRSQLYRMLDHGYLDQAEFDELFNLSGEIAKMSVALIKYLKSTDLKGYRLSEPELHYEAKFHLPEEFYSTEST